MLQLKDLSFGFGDQPVLLCVDLEVGPGEMVGLLGPNGAGKSTLLRLITRGLRPQGGQVMLDGTEVSSLSRQELARRVALLPQAPVLPPAFTALEIVLMGRTPHLRLLQMEGRRDLEVIHQAMLATRTWEFAQRRVDELSGGERQRVILARALAQEAPLLLLDEPTAHLDVAHQTATFDLVRSLLGQGLVRAVLGAIHDLTLAAQYCDRLYLLSGGRILSQGSPAQVLTVEHIAQAYQTEVCILPHPRYGTPAVLPLSEAR